MYADSTILRTGSTASFGVALAYLASGICAVLMPSELQGRPDISPHVFWTVLSQHPYAHLAFHWSWVAAGLCGIAAVPAISSIVWSADRGKVLWSAAAGRLGFAVLARSHLMEVGFDRRIIARYLDADPAFQQAVHAAAGLALDVPDGVLTYGAVGVWVITISRLGMRTGLLPRGLCTLGFLAGAAYFAGFLGYAFALRPLIVLSVGVGGFVLAPAWYGWAAAVLRQRAAATA